MVIWTRQIAHSHSVKFFDKAKENDYKLKTSAAVVLELAIAGTDHKYDKVERKINMLPSNEDFFMSTKFDVDFDKTVEELKKYEGVVAIIIFGSSVKSKETKPLSDIDIAVIVKDPDREIEAEIGSMSSNRLDIVLFHRLPLHIQFEVLKFGKEEFVRDEEYVLNIKREVLRNYLEMSRTYERIARKVLT